MIKKASIFNVAVSYTHLGEAFRFDGQRKSPGAGRCDFDSDRAADLCGTHVFLKSAEISS